MSRVTDQQELINKAVDALEKLIQTWAALCSKINASVQTYIDSTSVVATENSIETLEGYIVRLESLYNQMDSQLQTLFKRLEKLPVGADTSVSQLYHRQWELFEFIVNSYRDEWILRDDLVQKMKVSTSKQFVSERQEVCNAQVNMLQIQNNLDILKTSRSFSGVANRHLR
ncbi:hypothetical protein EIN_462530 [Entamoeba invadens IP1]|uniref:Uncharacterized protein n=1 Tax=Entamoeba invadens IP1 TaxID=370355 RepID=A0A0A1U695_ENTIV|nr:hypothetical protein EIN_462530 [Entamoeba invadens IP1]ELP89887.1 hypothetical protein EIN_462530 [Entamoeba invadens IP1]|eukprot:XP_004256658.1 hypothetical protein EIN_462530 [Entamoeba invadens IP1]